MKQKDNWPSRWGKADLESILEKMAIGANLPQSDVQISGYLPISRIETIAFEKVDLTRVKYVAVDENIIEKYSLQKGDILFSHINSDKHLGKTAIFNGEVDLIHGVNLLLIRAKEGYDKNLLNYLFKHYRFQGKFIDAAQRAVNQSSINQKKLNRFEIPLIPESEQQRIVARLDAIFGHLDVLKEKLDRIPELLKNFRQQVLTQAVKGDLTREWREGKELGEWEETKLNDLIEFSSNGLSKRAGTIGEEVTVLRLADFKNGIRFYGNERKIILDEKERGKYVLDFNDLLVIRVNGSVDLAGLFIHYDEIGSEEAYCDHFIRIKVKSSKLISKFLTFITNSGEGRKYLRNSLSTSAGQNTINQKSVGNLILNLPPIQEQEEIIKQVETLFGLADKIESQSQSLKAKIDNLPQAILAKAFRGELVGQDVKEYVREVEELGMVAEDL